MGNNQKETTNCVPVIWIMSLSVLLNCLTCICADDMFASMSTKQCFSARQCRQELEDCICSVILKHQKPGNDKKISVYHMKPQVFTRKYVLFAKKCLLNKIVKKKMLFRGREISSWYLYCTRQLIYHINYKYPFI